MGCVVDLTDCAQVLGLPGLDHQGVGFKATAAQTLQHGGAIGSGHIRIARPEPCGVR